MADQTNSDGGGSTAKDTLRAVAGAAALGFAARSLVKARRPRVLGMSLPRGMSPGDLDVKGVARRVCEVAAQLERTSEDVRLASAQAKRVASKLS